MAFGGRRCRRREPPDQAMAASNRAAVDEASARTPCFRTGVTRTANPENPMIKERTNKGDGGLRSRMDSMMTGHMGVVPMTSAA